jgi:NAD(P) transhydrogenase subunit alpha
VAKRAEAHRPNIPSSEENRTMLIGVPLETAAGETRVAVTPETAKKLKAQGHTLRVQSGAGVAASATDEAYAAAGAEITDRSDLIQKVRRPSLDELVLVKTGAALVDTLNPFDKDNLSRLAGGGASAPNT